MSGDTTQGGSYWAVITAPVLESKTLSDGAKVFYTEISRRTNQRGYCWASNAALAEAMRCGERTVSRYVAELKDAGFIECEFVGVNNRIRHAERRIRLAAPVPFRPDDERNIAAAAEDAADFEAYMDRNGEGSVAKTGEADMDNSGETGIANSGEVSVAKNGDHYKENNKSMNNTPLEPPSGGRRVPERARWKPERFEAFWEYYRKNVNPANRAPARKAWDKLKPDDDTIRDIGLALSRRLKTDAEWQRGIGRPHASTYLNGQMWLDSFPTAQPAPSRSTEESERKEAFGVWT